MITIEQAQAHLPVGTRVRHWVHDRLGAVTAGQSDKAGAERPYDTDRDGVCCSIHVQWDEGRAEWVGTGWLEKVIDGEPDETVQAINAAMREVILTLDPEEHDRHAIKMALWMAYVGDREDLQRYLARCTPENLEKLAAGGRLLAEEARAIQDHPSPLDT
ncbi:hypothetical protein AB0395_25350 [Streptosporangium sp. NPDC051023]|uniref:hypothetical protein n=1 Tax=Streptosporangium sp. NPDC051023 TaxID=3155410 RepID=UPI00344F82F8